MAKVPARYVGNMAVVLRDGQGQMRDGDGNPLSTNILNPGDTLMIEEGELIGHTYRTRTKGGETDYLGVGRVILPEHKELSEEELSSSYGYSFHDGRSDFQAYVRPPTAEEKAAAKEQAKQEKAESKAAKEET